MFKHSRHFQINKQGRVNIFGWEKCSWQSSVKPTPTIIFLCKLSNIYFQLERFQISTYKYWMKLLQCLKSEFTTGFTENTTKTHLFIFGRTIASSKILVHTSCSWKNVYWHSYSRTVIVCSFIFEVSKYLWQLFGICWKVLFSIIFIAFGAPLYHCSASFTSIFLCFFAVQMNLSFEKRQLLLNHCELVDKILLQCKHRIASLVSFFQWKGFENS